MRGQFSVLLTVLSPSSSIRIHSITTSFDATSASTETKPNLSSSTDQSQLQPQQPQENLAVAVVTLPLIFRATFTIMVGPQTQHLVTLRTTGKIEGTFFLFFLLLPYLLSPSRFLSEQGISSSQWR
jgi:hypothetical protein